MLMKQKRKANTDSRRRWCWGVEGRWGVEEGDPEDDRTTLQVTLNVIRMCMPRIVQS